MRRTTCVWAILVALALFGAPGLHAQDSSSPETRPAFSLASSHIFTTKETPSISLTFQRVTALDFRVYRVNDPLAFFAKLRDPHQLGSEEPLVPQERTWLERIADWKADRRDGLRAFFRRQVSREYRQQRQARQDQQQVQLRQTVRYTTFAQAPLLNQSQLAASWREILPDHRDIEARRIPLDARDPGVYVVEAVSGVLKAYTVVIVSDIGLVTKTAPGQVLMFAANRFTGEPAANCRTQMIADQKIVAAGETASDGTLVVNQEGLRADDLAAVAWCGKHVAATDPGSYYLREASRELVGYIYTDKPIYRPGHTIHVKGILRWRSRGALLPFDGGRAEVVVSDRNDKVLYRSDQPVDAFGSLHATMPLPGGAALGYYTVTVNSGDQSSSGSFEVQEYRKPEFDVAVRPADRFVVQGTTTTATITARYYFGQPVAGGAVSWTLHRSPYYSPYRWDGAEDGEEEGGGWYGAEEQTDEAQTAVLDAQGVATITIPIEEGDNGRDYTARVHVRVSDASGRDVSGEASINATYGAFLVTAQLDRFVFKPGASASLRVRAVDYLGAPQPRVSVRVELNRISFEQGYDNPTRTRVSGGVIQTDDRGEGIWTTPMPGDSGDFEFSASARSDDRDVVDRARAWVPGRGEADDVADGSNVYLELIPDKKTYQPGDTARLLVRGDPFDSQVLVTKESQHISYHQVVRAHGNEMIEAPITEDDVGDTYVNIAFLKDDRLHLAEKRISVPAVSRSLQIEVVVDQPVVRPRDPGTFTITARDAAGQPVRAQLSVGVIDEAVYGVKKDETPDPLRFFYRREYSRVGTSFSREYSFVGYSGAQQLQLAQRRRPFTLADFKADRPSRPEVRKDFPDAIYWLPDVVTDAAGRAKVSVKYPDSLTTWRITVRAVTAATQVGGAVARTLTTKDLLVRVITPRFLTEGDQPAIPVIAHNYLPNAKVVAMTLAASGVAASGDGVAPASPTIASGDSHRAEWKFVADRPGSATFTAAAKTDADADAMALTLPVLPYGLKQETAAAGSIVDAGEHSVDLDIPVQTNPAARTIRIELAPSLAGSVLGALDFLTGYPYGCTEQTLSAFVPNLLVARALEEMRLPQTERLKTLDRQTSQGLTRLYDLQHEDGGWGWWKTDENHPFMTAYALYGLLHAKAAGFDVDMSRVYSGAEALRLLSQQYPRALPDLKAYEAYVLALVKGADIGGDEETLTALVNDVWTARDRMGAYGRALLLLTLDALQDQRAGQLAPQLLEEAQTRGDLAWWVADSDPLLGDLGESTAEATATAVKALTPHASGDATLERAVRWLLANRTGGSYWSSTKQTAMVLYGLLDYMRARNEGAADYTVDVLVNGEPAGSRRFTAKDLTAPSPVVVTAAGRAGANAVRLVKRGAGALYWSASARSYYTGQPLARTGSRTLAITRRYATLTPITVNNRIVYRETPFNGTAAPGDVLLVRLTAAGSNDWRYLLVEDPLPAGAEAVPRESAYQLERPVRWFWGSQREFRDDRVAIFLEQLERGRYEFAYLLKVITPGVFRAMPAQITPMYVPGVRASSDALTLTVTAPGMAAAAAGGAR